LKNHTFLLTSARAAEVVWFMGPLI
jgi:hypothetical protein